MFASVCLNNSSFGESVLYTKRMFSVHAVHVCEIYMYTVYTFGMYTKKKRLFYSNLNM